MEKYLFLDFDGVLNTEHYQNLLYHEGKALQDEYGAYFDPESVEQLKRIVDATRAKIVIESSWKYLGLDAMQEMWEVRDLPGQVVDITSSSVSDQWLLTANLDDVDPAMGHCKGMEIASWLTDNAGPDAHYVIIDDDLPWALPAPNPNSNGGTYSVPRVGARVYVDIKDAYNILYYGETYRIISLHSITGVDYKKAKSTQYFSFAEAIDAMKPDIVTFDANEPKVDHYEVSQMEFFDNRDKGAGAAAFFNSLSSAGLFDAFYDGAHEKDLSGEPGV